MKTIKTLPILFFLLTSFRLSPTRGAEERILPADALCSGERNYRNTLESLFPNLDFGFYTSINGRALGTLDDFEHNRILFFQMSGVIGKIEILRNGKILDSKSLEPAPIKILGYQETEDGELKESPTTRWIGCWIQLENTDHLRITEDFTYPFKGTMTATYDPDAKWLFSLQTIPLHKTPPADIHAISKRPLVKQVLDVLSKKNVCTMKFENCDFLVHLENRPENMRDEFPPPAAPLDFFEFSITSKIQTATTRKKEIPPNRLGDMLETFQEAAMAADACAVVVIHINQKTDDKLFRTVLRTLVESHFRTIYVDEQADKTPEETE